MAAPVVVDGRVAREKLDELLRLAVEHTELEFESFLDLSNPAHILNVVKNLIGMANAGSGGDVVVGVNDEGTPARTSEPVQVWTRGSSSQASRARKY